jgi:phosphate transport system protein
MMEDSKNIRRANSLMFVAKHLERLADHATNVAEMVIFMVKGEDVRHPHSRGLIARK